jgi:hypothetical protein
MSQKINDEVIPATEPEAKKIKLSDTPKLHEVAAFLASKLDKYFVADYSEAADLFPDVRFDRKEMTITVNNTTFNIALIASAELSVMNPPNECFSVLKPVAEAAAEVEESKDATN